MFDFYFVLTLLICLVNFSGLVLFRTNPEVLRRLPLRELRQRLSRAGVGWLGFEERLHLAGNREAVCYAGMEMLMTRGIVPPGWRSVNQATVAGDSGAAYFLAMLRYRLNPADHEALALLHGISGGPSLRDGRWYLVRRDLHTIAYRLWLPDRDVDPSGLLVEDPHVCTWAQCRHWGDARSCIIWYCSAECRIRREFDLWTLYFNGPVSYAFSRMWDAPQHCRSVETSKWWCLVQVVYILCVCVCLIIYDVVVMCRISS